MSLAQLTDGEKAVVFECLKSVAAGKVILHDWEFQTIMGIEPKDFLAVVRKWPEIDDSQEIVFLAINNSMNNLLGCPHEKQSLSGESLCPFHRAKLREFLLNGLMKLARVTLMVFASLTKPNNRIDFAPLRWAGPRCRSAAHAGR